MQDEKSVEIYHLASDPNALPPDAAPGDAAPEMLYLEIGRGLTVWENLEEGLGRTFALLMGPNAFVVAQRAYGVIGNTKTRLDMLEEAFSAHQHRDHPTLEQWKNVIKQVRGLAARRNEMAHGVVTQWEQNGKAYGYYLLPNGFNSNKNRSFFDLTPFEQMERFRYVAADLQGFVAKFRETREEIKKLVDALVALFQSADEPPK